MWQKEFAVERSMDEKLCRDRDGNPIPWYTYPVIEYLTQFDYTDKKIFEYNKSKITRNDITYYKR